MKIKSPEIDYRKFRLNKLNTDEFRHLKLLLFWPVFGLLFWYLEKHHPVDYYYPMYCSLDDKIPFLEIFYIPYLFWFIYIFGMYVYTLLYDLESYNKLIKFTIITYTAALVIFFIFPTCQELRPTTFERDNILTRLCARFYAFDTHTNVCPSLHVIGSMSVMFAGLHAKNLQHPAWKIGFVISGVLISISTVFMKQHSILDVFAAIPVCAVAYFICYSKYTANISSFFAKRRISKEVS